MLKRFSNKSWLIHNCKGQIAGSGFAIMLIGLLTGVGLIMDTGKLFETRMKVQTSIDASLIACGEYFSRKDKSLTSAEIISCLRKNFEFNIEQNGLYPSDCTELDPTSAPPTKDRYVYLPGSPPEDPGYMEINCSMKHETILLGLLPGVNIANITSGSSSTGQYSVGGNLPVALVLTLDLSASISEQDLATILEAAVISLEAMPNNSFLAVNTFNGGYNGNWKGKIWIKNLVGWGSNGDVWLKLDSDAAREEASQRIQTITKKYWTISGTYGQGALHMARKLFSNFNSNNQMSKGIIFLSDGMLNESSFPYSPVGAPYGGHQCEDNATACKSQYYTDSAPDSPELVVEYGSLVKSIPAVNDTWYKRNLYTQYDELDTGTMIQSWPINENLIPQLNLKSDRDCYGQSSGNAMSAYEADLARSEGIQVFAFCRGCGNVNGNSTLAMRRLSSDKDLPSNWLNNTQWHFKTNENDNCPGYGNSNGDADAWNDTTEKLVRKSFNYQRDIVENPKVRYANTETIELNSVTDIFKQMIWAIQKGNLSK